MKTTYLHLLLFFLLASPVLQAQSKNPPVREIRGEVVDARTGKALVLATVSLRNTNISTVTNSEGEFLLKIPAGTTDGLVNFSFLGYADKSVVLGLLKPDKNVIKMDIAVTELAEVNVNAPRDAGALVRRALSKRDENYLNKPTVMTAFYRETIKKRRRNVSLSEAVATIYKAPYDTYKKDAVQLYKSRKSTDYSRLDTVALKLQGGPFNALYVDVMKYPQYLFSGGLIDNYAFRFTQSTRINDRLVYVIEFDQFPDIEDPYYNGKLFIDADKEVLLSATYSLNIKGKEREAAQLFVRRKPNKVDVLPVNVSYRVDYREKEGRWYYGYSAVTLTFKVDWADRLFNSVYSLSAEMAITDWRDNLDGEVPKVKERIKKSIILGDEASGFSDPNFWGEYNIIEPEKSIESAIRKIQRQLRRASRNEKAEVPEVIIGRTDSGQ
jgi:hypothetical protein